MRLKISKARVVLQGIHSLIYFTLVTANVDKIGRKISEMKNPKPMDVQETEQLKRDLNLDGESAWLIDPQDLEFTKQLGAGLPQCDSACSHNVNRCQCESLQGLLQEEASCNQST